MNLCISHRLHFLVLVFIVAISSVSTAEQPYSLDEAKVKSASLSQEQRNSAQTFFKQAFELFKDGEFDAAALTFNKGLDIDPANAIAHYYLAESYARLKKLDLARQHYEQTRQLGGDSKEVALAESRISNLEIISHEEETKRLALEDQKRKEDEAEKNKVTVIFYRNPNRGTAVMASIIHNGTQVANLSSGSSFIYSTTPGAHTFGASYPGVDTEETFDFKPSQTYYILVGIGYWAPGITLQLVTEAEGKAAVKK